MARERMVEISWSSLVALACEGNERLRAIQGQETARDDSPSEIERRADTLQRAVDEAYSAL